ncbi:ExeM/NucH family extracellular endonuclease [Bacterioplanoides sp.]|uniref:ExeM/NucH family extracellular endonuclease n=1 Tax=Bacterioplanoides sp. TaxID=2066072 RepID=UPI003AFFC759
MKKTILGMSLMASVSSAHAALLINEVDADQASTDNAEFVELYDGGEGNTVLDGHSLVLFNGSNDSSYKAIDLTGYRTNSDGFFVLCGNAANTENCDLDVSPDTNLIQNGADAVALYQSGAANYPNGSTVNAENLVDALVYDTSDADDAVLLSLLNPGQAQVNENENGNKDTESNQRCGDGIAGNTDGYRQAAPTPGAANRCDVAPQPVIGQCGESSQSQFALISEVQGEITDSLNDDSPLSGQQVIVEAIVTLDKQGGQLANGDDSFQYSGFWLQEESEDSDNNARTSEAVFVFDFRNAVNVGDKVRLLASVDEFNDTTQLENVSDLIICSSDNTLPAPVAVSLPVTDLADWEALEGMRVTNNQNLVVSDLFGTGFGFGNNGEFVVSSRLHFQPTEIALPGSPEAATAAAERPLDVLLIDDGVAARYPSFIPFPDDSGFAADNPMRIGYEVPEFTGVIAEFRDNYQLIPESVTIVAANERTLAPVVDDEANLVVVGMNVLNYFNGDGQGGGFPTVRGARTAEAFALQSQKIVAALQAMNADVIALMELENDGFGENSAIQTLVNELNALQAEGDEYSIINPGVEQIGSDAIAVGLIYRAEKLTAVGETVILDSANSPLDSDGNPLFIDDKNRPSLIQTFEFMEENLTISVNHLKSKGSACGEENEGADGQGNCNQTRRKAAQALVSFLATQPTGIDTDQVMILGDLNAYSQEDPMQEFYNQQFTNLKYTDRAQEEQPYSFSFSGFLGSLDHALASDSLLENVVSVDAWHINSVEDSLMDYQTEENGQNFRSVDNYAAPDAYRSSDHDPIVVGLKYEEVGGSLFWLLVLMPVAGFVRRR